MHSTTLNPRIDRLLKTQLQGVLATQQQAQPYTSLMAFAHTPDLRYLIFATFRDTQKHANLLLNSAVSFLIDDRSNDPADYQHAVLTRTVENLEGAWSTIPTVPFPAP